MTFNRRRRANTAMLANIAMAMFLTAIRQNAHMEIIGEWILCVWVLHLEAKMQTYCEWWTCVQVHPSIHSMIVQKHMQITETANCINIQSQATDETIIDITYTTSAASNCPGDTCRYWPQTCIVHILHQPQVTVQVIHVGIGLWLALYIYYINHK